MHEISLLFTFIWSVAKKFFISQKYNYGCLISAKQCTYAYCTYICLQNDL